jgi:hypothetical protein
MKQPKLKSQNPPQRRSAAEAIIAIQSVMLLLVGIAGILSATTIVAGFKAITNANSAVALITDKAVITDAGDNIPIERVEGIVNNFHIVCAIALTIGGIVALASGVRLLLKPKS